MAEEGPPARRTKNRISNYNTSSGKAGTKLEGLLKVAGEDETVIGVESYSTVCEKSQGRWPPSGTSPEAQCHVELHLRHIELETLQHCRRPGESPDRRAPLSHGVWSSRWESTQVHAV